MYIIHTYIHIYIHIRRSGLKGKVANSRFYIPKPMQKTIQSGTKEFSPGNDVKFFAVFFRVGEYLVYYNRSCDKGKIVYFSDLILRYQNGIISKLNVKIQSRQCIESVSRYRVLINRNLNFRNCCSYRQTALVRFLYMWIQC